MISQTTRIVLEPQKPFSRLPIPEMDLLQGIVLQHERNSILNMLQCMEIEEKNEVIDALYSIQHTLTSLNLYMRTIALLRMIPEGRITAAAQLTTVFNLCDEVEKEDILEQLLTLICRSSKKMLLLEEIARLLEKLPAYSFMSMLKTITELPQERAIEILKRAQRRIFKNNAFMATYIVKSL